MVLFAALLGCAPGSLDADEAAQVFEALTAVNGDTWARIYASTAPAPDTGGSVETGRVSETGLTDASGKSLTWDTTIEGGHFGGTVDGPGSWEGSLTVDGTWRILLDDETGWSTIWSMDVAWDTVEWSDLRMQADFRWNLVAQVDSDGGFVYTSSIDGEVTSRGGATGVGALDYSTTATFAGGRYVLAARGTVGGNDISSSWDASETFGL